MSFGQYQFRRGTAAQWTSANPTLLAGEMAIETDTGLFKIGDGSTAWNSLGYGGVQGPTGPPATLANSEPGALTVAGAGIVGISTEAAREDHTHDMPGLATTSADGFMDNLDKAKLNNLWYDVTNYGFIGDDSFDNGTVWAAFFSTLPARATAYFPPGTYRTSTEFNINADKRISFKGAGKYATIIKATNTTQHIFRISLSAWYNTWEDMGFQHSGTPTAGAAIFINPGSTGSAVGTNIYRCWFNNVFIGIHALSEGTNGQAANLSVWDSLDISSNVVNSRGIIINGHSTNLVISNSTINHGYPPFHVANTACCEVIQSGAIQILGCDWIGGTNTLLLNGSAGGSSSIAAVYCTNTFFDQSAGSTVKIAGANIVNRVKFVQCGITGGNIAGATAVEIANTGNGAAGTATARADGIDFFDCDIYPNGGTGTITGILITGAQGVAISDCRISGWTNGITTTPAVSNGYTKLSISNNKMGATNNFTTPNTTGLMLNAGAVQYGALTVADNDFTGSTTPIVDNSTVLPSAQKKIADNVGMLLTGLAASSITSPALTTTDTLLVRMPVPANGLQVGDVIRMVLIGAQAAIGNPSIRLRFGALGAVGDAALVTQLITLGAAGQVMSTAFFTVRTLGAVGSSGVVISNLATGIADTTTNQTTVAATPAINTTVANFLSVTASTSASTFTVHSCTLEVL